MSEWPTLAHAVVTSCFTLPDADLDMDSWLLFEKEETRNRLNPCPHSCCMHVTLVLCETFDLLLRIWEGGNPEWIISWRLQWRDPWSDLLDAKTLFHAGDFDLTTDRSFEKGETREDVTSGPLNDDQLFCLLVILTLPQIVHLRRGRPVDDSHLAPLMTISCCAYWRFWYCSLVVCWEGGNS